MNPHYVNKGGELSWLLDDLVKRVPQVGKAVMLTELETADQWEAEKRLVRSSARGRLAHLV